jgi:hypothetical protein
MQKLLTDTALLDLRDNVTHVHSRMQTIEAVLGSVEHRIDEVNEEAARSEVARSLERLALEEKCAHVATECSLAAIRAAEDKIAHMQQTMSEILTENEYRVSDNEENIKALADEMERFEAQSATNSEKSAAKLRALHCLQKLMARPDAAQIFQDFDTDRDGTVSRAELHEGLRKIQQELTEVEMDEMMALVDADGDGCVDYSEFAQMSQMKEELARNEAKLQEERAAQEQRMQEESVATSSRLQELQSSFDNKLAELSEASAQAAAESNEAAQQGILALRQDSESTMKTMETRHVQAWEESRTRADRSEEAFESYCQSTSEAVQGVMDISAARAEELNVLCTSCAADLTALSAVQTEHVQSLAQLKRALEVHSCAFEALQDYMDELQSEVKENDIASTAECMLLHAAQVRQQEMTASMLQDAQAAFVEVNHHSETVARLLEEADHDRATFEEAVLKVQEHVDVLDNSISDLETTVSVDSFLKQAALNQHIQRTDELEQSCAIALGALQHELAALQSRTDGVEASQVTDLIVTRAVEGAQADALKELQETSALHDITLEQSVCLVQEHVDEIERHLTEAEVSFAVESGVMSASLSRCSEHIVSLREQAETDRERAQAENADLAQLMTKAISEVQTHVDLVEEHMNALDGHYTTELFMLQFMMSKLAEDTTAAHNTVALQINERLHELHARIHSTEAALNGLGEVVEEAVKAVQRDVDEVAHDMHHLTAGTEIDFASLQASLQRMTDITSQDRQKLIGDISRVSERIDMLETEMGDNELAAASHRVVAHSIVEAINARLEEMDSQSAVESMRMRSVLDRFAHAAAVRMDQIEIRFEEELAGLETGTELALRSLQAHVDVVENNLSQSETDGAAELIVLHALLREVGTGLDRAFSDIETLTNQAKRLDEDSRQEMREAVMPMVEQFENISKFIDETESQMSRLHARFEDKSLGPLQADQQDLNKIRYETLERSIMDLSEQMVNMQARSMEELNSLEHGTKLAVESVQAHIDQVEETVNQSDVSFCAEFVVVHAMTSAVSEHMASLKEQIDLRLKQMDFDYAMQLQNAIRTALEHRISELRADIQTQQEAAIVEASVEQQLMLVEFENRIGDKAAADTLSAQLSDLDVDVSLKHELIRAALEKGGRATVTGQSDHDVANHVVIPCGQLQQIESRVENELRRLENATEAGLLAVQSHVDVLQQALGKAEVALCAKVISLQAGIDSFQPAIDTLSQVVEDLADVDEKQSTLEIDIAHDRHVTSASLERSTAACASLVSRFDTLETEVKFDVKNVQAGMDVAVERSTVACAELSSRLDMIVAGGSNAPLRSLCSKAELTALRDEIVSEMDARDIQVTLDQQFMRVAIDEHDRLLSTAAGSALDESAQRDSEFQKEMLDEMEARDVELSMDHQLLQAVVEQLQSQVHSVAQSTAHSVADLQRSVRQRIDSEVASMYSSSLRMDAEVQATLIKLHKDLQQSKTISAQQLASLTSAMGTSAETARSRQEQDTALLSAMVTKLSTEVQATMMRSIEAVDSRFSTNTRTLSEKIDTDTMQLVARMERVLTRSSNIETRVDSELSEVSALTAALKDSVAAQHAETSASLEELSSRVAEASVDDTALTALRDELSERVAAVDASASSRVSAIETRVESELSEVSASSAALETTVATLSTQHAETSASLEELSSRSSALREELLEQVAEASATVAESNLRIEVVEDRVEGELAAVGSAMVLAAAESNASSAALETTVATLRTQHAETSASLEELSSRVAEVSVDDTALTALRDELSERVAEAHVLALEASSAASSLQSTVASVALDLQQVAAEHDAAASVSEDLAVLSSRLDELATSGDVQEVSTSVSLAVVEDVVSEHSLELSTIRQDLDAVRAAAGGEQ